MHCQKALYEIPPDVTYLNCAYLSPQLKAVKEAGYSGVDKKSYPWEIGPEDFFHDCEKSRQLFSQIIDAQADDISLIPSVSYGLETAVKNLLKPQPSKIVLLEEQFPSNVYPWRRHVQKHGGEICVVKREDGETWTEAILQTLNSGIDVAALPACHWKDGSAVDLETISQECRRLGVHLVVDGSQFIGARTFNLEKIQPDFLVTVAYKWLQGPYGIALMYAAPEHQSGEPLENAWLNRQGSENFANLVSYQEGFQKGARRYDGGQRANFVTIPMLNTALKQILDWGIGNIENYLLELSAPLRKQQKLGHISGVQIGKKAPQLLAKRFQEEKVFISVRGSSLRISPYLCNDKEDIEKFLEILKEFQPADDTCL